MRGMGIAILFALVHRLANTSKLFFAPAKASAMYGPAVRVNEFFRSLMVLFGIDASMYPAYRYAVSALEP